MNAVRFATVGGTSALTLDIALSVIPSLPRPLLARFVARAIERLDEQDGDPDLEASGDELDFNDAEDDFQDRSQPICPVWRDA